MIGRTNVGGAGLNFKVVGNPQPESPKENTIWVDTDTAITGWEFSSAQPEGAEGLVWISTGTFGPAGFNALKKNGIQVYPGSAKQFISGAWVDKDAKTYQNGAWVDWIAWLYKDGDQCTDLTGGWDKVTQNGMGITFGSDVSITYISTANIGAYFNTTKKIDVTSKSWLRAQGLITGGYDTARHIEIALCKNLPSNFVYTADSSAKLSVRNVETQIDVDLRALSGEYYIVVACGGVTGTVGDIRLE